MRTFIFYTLEGYSESPINEITENCQLLGEATGETARDALNNLLKENEWIIEQGFHLNEGKVIARELADSRRYFF